MTMPSFTPTILYESGRTENSVTITTLPAPGAQSLAQAQAQVQAQAQAQVLAQAQDMGGSILQQTGKQQTI